MDLQDTSLPIPNRPFWSPAEVAELLPDTEKRTVARWCKEGRVPGAKRAVNGRWLIPATWVHELLANESAQPSDPAAAESPPQDDPLPGLEE